VDVDLLDRWLNDLVDQLGIDRIHLVAHDWGGYALGALAIRPERLASITAINVLPLDGRYKWHFLARLLWRREMIGELSIPLFNGPGIWVLSSRASDSPYRIVEHIKPHLD